MKALKTNYKIDWMNISKIHHEGKHEKIERIIDRLEWDDDFYNKSLPMMPCEGIKQAIRELRIPNVSAISYNCNEMAPYGFYGIEGNFKSQKVQIFIMDLGSELTVICNKVFTEKEI